MALYWPLHDFWQSEPCARLRMYRSPARMADGPARWGHRADFVEAGVWLRLRVRSSACVRPRRSAGASCFSPEVRIELSSFRLRAYLPLATLERLLSLVENGATVVFQDRLPEDVPGAADLQARRAAGKALWERVVVTRVGAEIREDKIGRRGILLGDLNASLAAAGVQRERLVDQAGLLFIRRRHEQGRHYFLVNQSVTRVERWLPLATSLSLRGVDGSDDREGRRCGGAAFQRWEAGGLDAVGTGPLPDPPHVRAAVGRRFPAGDSSRNRRRRFRSRGPGKSSLWRAVRSCRNPTRHPPS